MSFNFVTATINNDLLNGTDAADFVQTLDGNDTIYAGQGDDTVIGGNDRDVLGGGSGKDLLHGNAGNDTMVGGAGDDVVNGGTGNDIIHGDHYIPTTSTLGENLVVNGSFENYTTSYNNCYQTKTISGWTTNYTSGIDIKTNNYYGSAADGNTWLELEGYGNSGISQQVDTETGKQYQVSFDYKGHSQGSAYNNKIEVYWDGKLVDTITEQGSQYSSYCYSSCNGSSNNDWKTYTYTLEGGKSDLTKLTFKAVGYSYKVGGQLDNVEVRKIYQDDIANNLGTEKVTGNDFLNGGDGNDQVFGGAGNDTLNGTDHASAGYNQEDRLNGGSGADTFVLGNGNSGYYNAQGWCDYATIEDFNRNEDKVQLNGSSDQYWLGSSNGNSYLYEHTNNGWDGVAVFENVRLNNCDLNSSAFEYVNGSSQLDLIGF